MNLLRICDDSVFVLNSEKSHPLLEGKLPGGWHLLQEAKLEVRPCRNGPLPTLDGGADGTTGEQLQVRPGDRVK